MSYYMICPNCGKGTIGRYATDNSLCGECSDNSSTTDELSVEKLQEHLLPYKKEMVQKIIDEKMQLVTADEFLKLHKESLTAIRENDKLQEQLNTAKKALTEISEDVPKPPKYNLNAEFWRTQWSEASGAHLMEYLRAEKLQEQLNTAKKALTEAIGDIEQLNGSDDTIKYYKQALAAIGWGGCPVGAVGKNGLTKEEIEGSGDGQ